MDLGKPEKILELANNFTMKCYRSKERFLSDLNSLTGNLMVKFSASWCQPCKKLQQKLETLNFSAWDLQLSHIDVDQCHGVDEEFNVSSLPTFILFKNGQEVFRQKGYEDSIMLETIFDKYFGRLLIGQNTVQPNMFLNQDDSTSSLFFQVGKPKKKKNIFFDD